MIPYFSVIYARDCRVGGFAISDIPVKNTSISQKLYNLKNYIFQYSTDEIPVQHFDKNKLPWKLKTDLQYFKKITTQNDCSVCIMGRLTYESLPNCVLPNRKIIVVTSSQIENTLTASNLNDALLLANTFTNNKANSIFVIGGISLLKESFEHPMLEKIYETIVHCDNNINYSLYFQKKIPTKFVSTNFVYNYKNETNEYNFSWNEYEIQTDEKCYLNLLKTLIFKYDNEKSIRNDRTNIGTVSMFCPPDLTFDLQKKFPLLTTKKVSFKNVTEELLWIIRGETNNKFLQSRNVNIWNGNSSREFLDKVGLNNMPEGEMKKIYGFQLRNYGGDFDANNSSHIGKNGFDQLQYVIDLLQNDPFSRRILINLWNPCDLKDCALPPCHFCCQFYVTEKDSQKYLSCKLHMRSCDLFLGSPYNAASYALLTHLLATKCNMHVDKLIISIGDAHIYINHIPQVKEQLARSCRQFPTLEILNTHEKLEDYIFEDFKVHNYNPHTAIKAKMAV